MKRMLVDRRQDPLDRRLAAERTAAVVDVRLELAAELPHVARHRVHGEVAERAKRLAEHAVADAGQQIEIRALGSSVLELGQELHYPARPFAARRALAARL